MWPVAEDVQAAREAASAEKPWTSVAYAVRAAVKTLMAGALVAGAVGGGGAGSTRFYHGTTSKSALSILSEGLKPVSENTAPHAKGSFFTHAAALEDSLWVAGRWPSLQGKAPLSGSAVVEMTVPNSVLAELTAKGMVSVGSPASLRFYPYETVFAPEALQTLNAFASFRLVPTP